MYVFLLSILVSISKLVVEILKYLGLHKNDVLMINNFKFMLV